MKNKTLEQLKQEQDQFYTLQQQEQTEQMELQPEQQPEQPQDSQELSLSDGQPTATPTLPEMNAGDSSLGLPTTTATTDFYDKGEFRAAFSEFLEFLHNPQTPAETVEALAAKGQGLAADKIYNLASKYKWLNWLIDRRTKFVQDSLLITLFAYQEADAIGKTWFNFSIKEKATKWLENQAKQKIKAALKPSGWGFLGRLGVGKRQKAEN